MRVPELRHILKSMKILMGEKKATRKFVYSLFPYGYGQQGCLIAGMRQPRKLWLDL
jgi:tRNA 2-thiouridine synthesizing protein E